MSALSVRRPVGAAESVVFSPSCSTPLDPSPPRTITSPSNRPPSRLVLLAMPDHAILPAVLRQALDGDRPLETIPVPTDSVPRVELTNFITVGTYSYLDSEVPTLLIPGRWLLLFALVAIPLKRS